MIQQFIAERRTRWEQLERLLRQSQRRRRLSPDELTTLGRLYRQAASDLAVARRDYPDDRATRYLEQLVGRAHPAIYRRDAGGWASLWRFVTAGFPQAYRQAGRYTAVAFALLALPFLVIFAGTVVDPAVGRSVVPRSSVVQGIERGESWLEIERAERGFASSTIMTNNIQVTIVAFSGGITFGLLTVYVLVFNGLVTGAVAGLAATHGLGIELLSFVSPHGGIELSVIFLAGGAGLRMGHAMLSPGLLSRGAALTVAARQAVPLVAGGAVLLVIAGLFEGFVSPSGIPNAAKYIIGVVNLAWLYAYLLGAGRRSPALATETE
jgi:uncharacterized membrane protein SpoIIM required for sporulation